VVSAVVLAVGMGSLALVGMGFAADEKDPREAILKIASALEKKDSAAAKKQAAALKDAELEAIMNVFKLRKAKGAGGVGIGSNPGAITPDGIEAKLTALSKPLDQNRLNAESGALAEAAYRAAAVAEVIHDKCPVPQKQGEKDPKKWREWSEDLSKAALEMAQAAKAKNAKDLRAAANRANSACSNCHGVFRD
jgi:hypothetical protein